jgi:hypothetical protein
MDHGHQLPSFTVLGLEYLPVDKAIAITDCLENQFTPHDLSEENHERRVEAKVQVLLEAADRIRPCDLQIITFFKTKKGLWN